MKRNVAGPSANALTWEGYSRIDFKWEWSVCVQKALLALVLLAGLVLGGEDLVITLKQLLD